MAQQIPGAEKLIEDRGGYRVVAALLGWPPTTVHTFVRLDRAPQYRWDAIAALPIVEKDGGSQALAAQPEQAA